jgi:hypothetical protein
MRDEQEEPLMKVVVQIAARDDAKAWDILQRHSPGAALPNRTFVVSEEAVEALRRAGIRLTELSREAVIPDAEGLVAGERI